MNLLMCCTPIGRESKYLEELRFVVIGAIFFKALYPNGKVFVGTTHDAQIPSYMYELFNVIRYPFEKKPFAISRMSFYHEFITSEELSDDTLITGCDVLICKKFEDLIEDKDMAMTYRYHRTMPYCSDLIFVRKKGKDLAANFCKKVLATMAWMPREIQHSWAEQLSIAIEMGFLASHQFDGSAHDAPNYINKIKLLPGDDYLFTPNDFFSSLKHQSTGQALNDTPDSYSLVNHADNKSAIHFKGNRKNLFIIFAYLCKLKGIVDFEKYNLPMQDEFLFKEYFDNVEKNKSKLEK